MTDVRRSRPFSSVPWPDLPIRPGCTKHPLDQCSASNPVARGSAPLVHTVVARSAAEMDRLQPVWDELYNRSTATLFQSFAWNRLAAASFPAREEPCVVCVESGSGAAIIPAAVADYG